VRPTAPSIAHRSIFGHSCEPVSLDGGRLRWRKVKGKDDPNNSDHKDEQKTDKEKKREEEERQKRISELEDELDRIRDRLAGTTDLDTQASLESQAEQLQAELDELEGK
jgi:molecular chaperone GrpE (heat shock protein)